VVVRGEVPRTVQPAGREWRRSASKVTAETVKMERQQVRRVNIF
jgi:hypothetical protein